MSSIYIIAGVSGVGKTTIGHLLSQELTIPFYDGDDFHPEANVTKMSNGHALSDADRLPWLHNLASNIKIWQSQNGAVLACSALKEDYRQILMQDAAVKWIFLEGDKQLIHQRLSSRKGHYFKPDLLESQYKTYESPLYGLHIKVDQHPEKIIEQVIEVYVNQAEFGLIGLGVMGTSLARNFARHQIKLSLYNRFLEGKEEQVALTRIAAYNELKNAKGFESLQPFVASLQLPRKIFLMVQAGEPTDAVINSLLPYLSEGDIIIDGGNAHYKDTARRVQDLKNRGIRYLGVGVSGGEEGALNGPSMMPGGDQGAYNAVEQYLTKIAAEDKNNNPCCAFMGEQGAGHFVKMIHNGIEYAEMQILAELYQLLRVHAKWSPEEIAELFESWKIDENSYLLEITIKILKFKQDGELLLAKIKDQASQKGTGGWSTIAALELGEPTSNIAEAVLARYLSAHKKVRTELAKQYPVKTKEFKVDKTQLKAAYRSSRLINHVQGFELIRKASAEYDWSIDLKEVARVWTNGCIIRSQLMEKLTRVFPSDTQNLLKNQWVYTNIQETKVELAHVVANGLLAGCSLPVMSATLNYINGMTTAISGANLIQAQRDFFGAHTYQLIDDVSGKWHHTQWEI